MESTAGAPLIERAPVKAAAPAAVPHAAAAAPPPPREVIVPQKRSFHWWTPLSIAKDFVKGTALGFGKWLAKGGQTGFKLGLLLAAVAFFAPLYPPLAVGLATLGLPTLPGTAAVFIPNGLNAIVAGLGYGLAGALIGAGFGGVMGLLTGGAYELKMRGRKEKYAEELAERNETRGRGRSASQAVPNWRDYGEVYDDNEERRQFRQFVLQHERPGNWTDFVSQPGPSGGRGY